MTKQVKSKQRVADHGEVFTAEREVKAMCDLVADECLRIDSRFLEPACGDGNFLAEILSRKLDVVTKKYKRNPVDYEKNALLALGSIYGVELLMDNVLACRKRLFDIWKKFYMKAVKKADRKDVVPESAEYILEKNIICGNALSLHQVDEAGRDTDVPIIFSQWSFVTGPMMKREDYTFEQLLTQNEPQDKKGEEAQLSLDALDGAGDNDDGEGTLIRVYPPIQYWRLKEYG
jgi:hypothetical protein